jgi:hypothetical protein
LLLLLLTPKLMPRPKKTDSKPQKTDSKPQKNQPKDKSPSPKQQQTEQLTGSVLIHKVRELESLSKEQKARACGYITVNKNGLERVNMMQFLNALIEAEGIDLDSPIGSQRNGRGRTVSYRISVQTTGNLLIGSAYTKQLGLNPGDEFEITLGRKHIRLKQLGAEEGDTVADSE